MGGGGGGGDSVSSSSSFFSFFFRIPVSPCGPRCPEQLTQFSPSTPATAWDG